MFNNEYLFEIWLWNDFKTERKFEFMDGGHDVLCHHLERVTIFTTGFSFPAV